MSILLDLFEWAWHILVENRRAYFALNALYYGLMLVFMIYVSFDPALHESILKQYNGAFMVGPLALVDQTASTGLESFKIVVSALLTNVLGFSYGEITLPSFIIPFVGIVIGLYRAIVLGMFFSPTDPAIARIFLPHLPTLLLEGQAAILAMLGVYIHGRAFLWPKTVGEKSRWKGYLQGLREGGILYLLILVVLLVSAIYGMVEAAILAAL